MKNTTNTRQKRIIITGNIGCGKSTVTKILEKNGYSIISADELSAKILKNYHVEVSKMFKLPPQQFDTFKKTLGTRVFTDKDVKKQLEDFMLPRIKLDIEFWCNYYERKLKPYVIEMPTLFEVSGLKHYEDTIIMVQADKDVRTSRILERNKHLSIQDVLNRMKSQIQPSKKIEFCDAVLWNNDGIDELKKEVAECEFLKRNNDDNNK